MSGRSVGQRGEALAADFLERRGWRILDRNYRVGRKEVDLVARRGEVVAFVEVKARRGVEFGHPLEAITPRKQREVAAVASVWIQRNGTDQDAYRFDAVAIVVAPGAAPVIEHVENAWGI